MAHSTSATTNGGTLEDCHTNIFVLTELNGLKWCRFSVSNPSQVCTEIREDPVLCAYGRCLSQSLLCVWRRVPPSSVPAYGSRVDFRLASEKELWVFWYGDEPDWKNLCTSAALTRVEEGSWDKGVEYDTRSLLFKALHNLIERCLLTRDFVRLGRWFVRPLNVEDVSSDLSQNQALAFSFSFFVHGENNVCVCVNVQSQPAVYRLTRDHLNSLSSASAGSNNGRRTVILAPWSLKGVLNMDDLKSDNDSQARKREIFHEWSKFYPLPPETDNVENMGYVDPFEKERQEQLKAIAMPRVVEVSVGGVRLLHPSCYVLLQNNSVEGKPEKSRTNSSRNDNVSSADSLSLPPESPKFDSSKFQKRIVERVEEELTLMRKKSAPVSTNPETAAAKKPTPVATNPDTPTPPVAAAGFNNNAVDDGGVWDFILDSKSSSGGTTGLQKEACQCSNHPTSSSASQLIGGVPNKAQLKVGLAACGGRQRLERQAKLSKCGVFHRRSTASPVPMSNFNRMLPPPPTDLAPNSVNPPAISTQDVTAVNSPALNNGIEAISRPSSRVPASSSSIQMISPAPPIVTFDQSLQKPSLLTHLDQTISFASTLPSTSSNLELQSTDGANIIVVKDNNLKTKRLRVSSSSTPLDNSKLKKLRTYDNFPILPSAESQSSDIVDSSLLYVSNMFATHDNALNLQHSKKFQMWTTTLPSTTVEIPLPAINCAARQEVEYNKFVNSEPTRPDLEEFDTSEHLELMNDALAMTSDEQNQHLSPISGGSHEPATYQPLLTHNDYVPSFSLPDNIMADDSSSDNEDDSAPFLSPPPSHGHEEEVNTKKPKTITAVDQIVTNSFAPRAISAQMFGDIYPTPPSVAEGMTQFSPEAAPSWHDSHIAANSSPVRYPVETNISQFVYAPNVASGSKFICDRSSYGKITERPVSANYLATGKFGPFSKFSAYFSSNFVRKMNDYRPKLQPNSVSLALVASSHHSQVAPQFVSSTISRLPQVIQPQPLPPPPYPGRSVSYNGAAQTPHWSSPPSVRPFMAEQSPLATNSPMNSTMARTPRTPAMTDLQSPSSNASSHYGRNVGSNEYSLSVYTGQSPEAHSLVLSLLLCDTFVDLHKDVIFDSCPLCVCSMNIQGFEMGLYVPSSTANYNDPHNQWASVSSKFNCNCGFSAARHRYLSYKSGLFYEDEHESTGAWRCRTTTSASDDKRFCPEIIEIVRYQSLTMDLTRSMYLAQSFARRNDRSYPKNQHYSSSELELNDFAELCNIAMEQACLVVDCTTPTRDDMSRSKSSLVHSWGFLKSHRPVGNTEAISVLKNLLPILQESVQKPRGVRQVTHSVEGPLTWRQFHRKCFHRVGVAGRDDLSGPEPVPLLLAAADREWVTISPFALRLWDRLALEPYGQPKDVVYLAVVPDNQFILQKSCAFFRELSKVYEGLRLGRHCPITRVLKDGIMRVGKSHASKISKQPVDPWFDRFEQCSTQSSKNTMGARLKLYAQVCRYYLAPHLQSENVFDRSILRDVGKENQPTAAGGSATDSAMPPPPTPNVAGGLNADPVSDPSAAVDGSGAESSDVDNSPIPHVVVIYLVNSFTYGADTEDEEQCRFASTALFRCYLEMLKGLSDSCKGSIQLQIVPLQTILEFSLPNENEFLNEAVLDTPTAPRSTLSQTDYFRQLALNVFAQSRSVGLNCMLSLQSKPLTGFGPAASRIELIKKKMEKSPNLAYQIYCPPVILAPTFEHSAIQVSGTIGAGDIRDCSNRVLFITYCLSDKQRWLLAAASDHQGALLENCVINLNIPDRWCASRRAVIWEALRKLWNFVCGLMATGCQPWRLVIGRLGRIGHEELKAWAHLLSKGQLRATSRSLRDNCGVCHPMPGVNETPSVLSACLISTESESHFRLFSDSFAYDERFGQNAKQCPLSTPEDVSSTHIMVFPTSALIQMNQSGNMSSSGVGQMDETDDDFNLDGWDMPEGIMPDDIGFSDILNEGNAGLQNKTTELPEDSIQQQPLALGYIVSTAPIDVTPDWFWSDCPSSRFLCPVHLRSSLHINTSGVQQNDDQFLTVASKSGAGSHGHPLDSSLTTDVLRYVLETYNALSWLSLDPTTGDRRSCLPVHMQALCRLYNAVEDLL